MIPMENVVITAEDGQIRMMKYPLSTDRPHTEYEFKQVLLENAKQITEVTDKTNVYSLIPNSFKRIRECDYKVTYKIDKADIILCELNPENIKKYKIFSKIETAYNFNKDINVLKSSLGYLKRYNINDFADIINEIENMNNDKCLNKIYVTDNVKDYFAYGSNIRQVMFDKEEFLFFNICDDIDTKKLFPIDYFRNLTTGIIINDEVFESFKEQLATRYSAERDIILNIIDTCNLLHSIKYVIRLVTEGFVSTYSLPIIKKKCGELAYSRDDFESAIRMMQKTHTLTTDNLNWACQYYTKKKDNYTIEIKPSDELIELAKQTTQEVNVLLNQVHEDSESCESPHTQCDNDPQ